MTDPKQDADGSADRYSDEEAGAALKRAAQLQLEAAERVEHAAETVPSGSAAHGYGRQELVDAAAQFGIDEQFVALALREQAERGALSRRADDATLVRWLGTKRKSLSVSRTFDATGQETLDACCRVFESPRFALQLRGATEGHPLEGGVLEFTMPRLSQLAATTGGYTPLAYRLEQLEMWTLRVTFRSVERGTEVVLHGDLRPGALANLKFAKWSAGIGGALGGAGAAFAAVSSGMLALAAAPAALGAAAAGGLLMLGYRKLYSSVLHKTEREFGALLDSVGGELTRKALVSPREAAPTTTPSLGASPRGTTSTPTTPTAT